MTALAARAMFQSGFAYRIMAANPWMVLGVSLVGSIGSMMGVLYTPPEKTVQKHLFWLVSINVNNHKIMQLAHLYRHSMPAKQLL